MNAGSRDEWIGKVTSSVTLYRPDEGLLALKGHEVDWGYRRSGLAERGIIVEAVLRLQHGDATRIRRIMEGSLTRRKKSQPLGSANAGSVFRNPPGASAGRLIEEAGLKGHRIGDAEVSEVHANFIINRGRATANDIARLVRLARDTVEETYGTRLTPEIRFLGSFEEP
jgi:UDP-N-acetylmuramate dehydrogenase